MKTVVTALGSFPTGTEIADAVTGYSLALARAQPVDARSTESRRTRGTSDPVRVLRPVGASSRQERR